MMRDENSNVVSMGDSNINGIQDTIETNSEGGIKAQPVGVQAEKSHPVENKEEHSLSVTFIDTSISAEHSMSSSVPSVDTNASRKYRITLEQARIRVLRAMKKAKKRNLSSSEDD